jgi:succinate dehydrogenase flavin-adding protein (antitoxin of CptAB toxin-antitoxin module)
MARMTKKDKEFFEKVIENIYNDLRGKLNDHTSLLNSHNLDIAVKILTKLSELKKEEQQKIFKSPCWKSVTNPYIYYKDRQEHVNVEYSKLTDNYKNSFKSSVGFALIRRGKVDKEFREFLLENADGTLLRWLIQSKEINTTITKESANKIFDRVKNAGILKNLIKIAPYDSVMYGFENYKGKDKSVICAFRNVIGYSDVTEENALSYVINQPHKNLWAFVNTVYNCGFASKAKQEDITSLINFVKEKEWDHWYLQSLASYLFAFCTKETIYSNLFFFKTHCPDSLALKLDLQ